jgi:hypothetical protein
MSWFFHDYARIDDEHVSMEEEEEEQVSLDLGLGKQVRVRVRVFLPSQPEH